MKQLHTIGKVGHLSLISVGSNGFDHLFDATETVQKSILTVSAALNASVQSSRIYRTPAFPSGSGPDFANAVVAVHSGLAAPDVLAILHRIEQDFGRVRTLRWGQRVLDLDLLAHGADILPDLAGYSAWRDLSLDQQMKTAPEQLILPHPRIQDRSFVLVPMMDVAPDWVHPVSGLTTAQMLAALDPADTATVIPLE